MAAVFAPIDGRMSGGVAVVGAVAVAGVRAAVATRAA
jgi:hypothetical protein